jgi:hypothetical protein
MATAEATASQNIFISAKRGPERKEPIAVAYPQDAADHPPLLSL